MVPPERLVANRIRSFVMRAGRMTPSQLRGWEKGFPLLGLAVDAGPLEWDTTFGFAGRCFVEVGFGMVDSLLQMAEAEATTQFIGIEVHRPGVGRLLAQALTAEVNNLRVYAEDAVEVLTHCLASESVDAFHVFFPDPWHKKKHHKRRLIQSDFVRQLSARLRPGGCLHLATDWAPYVEHMFDVLEAEPTLLNTHGPRRAVSRPDYRPLTKFEARGERLGHGVWDLIYHRQ